MENEKIIIDILPNIYLKDNGTFDKIKQLIYVVKSQEFVMIKKDFTI